MICAVASLYKLICSILGSHENAWQQVNIEYLVWHCAALEAINNATVDSIWF